MFAAAGAEEAKVLVYEEVLQWVLEKQRSEGCGEARRALNPEITGLDAEDLQSLLAEAALCVVQSGGESAKVASIEERLAKRNKEAKAIIDKARKAKEENPLQNALAAFYLKAGQDNSVEFLHKSFGEFLCALRLNESVQEWTEKSGRRRKTFIVGDEEFDWQVFDLLGATHLTEEVVGYLRVLLRREATAWEALYERLYDFYLRWTDGEFIEVFEFTEEMLPLKKARQLQRYGIKLGQRQADIYAGLNVLVLLLEIHRHAKATKELQEKIHFHACGREGEEERFDRTKLLRVIGVSQGLTAFAFSKWVGKFLRGADLSGADLSGADLSRADLSRAYLSRAYLSGADLSGAYLSRAYLNGAYLNGAYLNGADLSGAYLNGADLSGAYLSGADLSGADLSRADFSKLRWDRETKWDGAIGLHEAVNVPPELAEFHAFAVAAKLSRGRDRAIQGEIEAALSDYAEVQRLHPELEISADFWNTLCWFGCLHDRAADVLFAGDKAIELEPDDATWYDTRGLARALTGDLTGAAEDFQVALEGGVFGEEERQKEREETPKQKRQRWLAALQAGENPFTEREIAVLRNTEG